MSHALLSDSLQDGARKIINSAATAKSRSIAFAPSSCPLCRKVARTSAPSCFWKKIPEAAVDRAKGSVETSLSRLPFIPSAPFPPRSSRFSLPLPRPFAPPSPSLAVTSGLLAHNARANSFGREFKNLGARAASSGMAALCQLRGSERTRCC